MSATQIQSVVIHAIAAAGIIVLLAMNRIDQTTGAALLAAIVGINTPSPLQSTTPAPSASAITGPIA